MLWNPVWRPDSLEAAETLRIKKEEEEDITVEDAEEERPRGESDAEDNSRQGLYFEIIMDRKKDIFRRKELKSVNSIILKCLFPNIFLKKFSLNSRSSPGSGSHDQVFRPHPRQTDQSEASVQVT